MVVTANDAVYGQFTKQLVDVKPAILFKVNDNEEYDAKLSTQGLKVVEVYSNAWGPCFSILPTLKRIKIERDPDPAAFQINICQAECIDALEQYRGQSRPTFLFYRNGKLVHTEHGPNTPELERRIIEFTPGNPDQDDLEENPFYLAKKAASRPGSARR
mmetsp:Transcript_29593/g.64583  ORF Transcript_29593/g.64583 Transcript_29593/m.64583 type:complete len:159 (-) Transcript_29593:356-832(-)|eukprot:CAMPEP_0118932596 /NCGR_PEP_ID=MMETSP1169-20130426/10516_1 /TAXON_ID=36882 /ORGANISM="Pyramimonas obovata, Strain CCMP722" /LENGTH=158 /DNA_ID=CAMNT_0006875279 /DNA_START=169 /DNA_END=645 /DNA_ORIENTATION=-